MYTHPINYNATTLRSMQHHIFLQNLKSEKIWIIMHVILLSRSKFTITKIFILILYSWLVWYICYKTSFVLIDAQIITSITLYVNIANKCMHIITKMQTWSFIFIPHIFDCLLISQSIISKNTVVDHSRCRCIQCCIVRYRYN